MFHRLRFHVLALVAVTLALASSAARADSASVASERPAFETNVLWPFFPGGLVDLKVVVPVAERSDFVIGAFSDFAWRFVRDDTYGRVFAMGTKLAWRQFVMSGFHLEGQLQLNWRHEEDRPDHPETLDGFQGRAWIYGGYQHALGARAYVNTRLGLGVHLFRTDELGDTEKKLVPAADLNLGLRF